MAGHGLVWNGENQHIIKLFNMFVNNVNLDLIKDFERYDINGKHLQKGEFVIYCVM